MIIRINGKDETIDAGMTIGAFLTKSKVEPGEVVVELNGAIISKDEYASAILNENDRLEVLRFVGGG